MMSLRHSSTSRRLALASVIGAAVLGAGAGVAYAAGNAEPAETGYATVVDEGAADAADCPTAEGDAAEGSADE